jgi:hypothetical protein
MAAMTATGTIAKQRSARVAGALLWLLALPAFADTPKLGPLPEDKPKLTTPEQKEAPTAFAGKEPTPKQGWGVGKGKSYVIPFFEVVGFNYALNRFNHYAVDESIYGSPSSNFSQNIRQRWIIDTDPFAINQFAHPYQGAVYQSIARASGLSFWESAPYTLFGSVLWEYAGEHTTPSINDLVATGIGGNFLGEPLFRMASLLLETSDRRQPSAWRVLGATILSPPVGVNRGLFGDKFDGVFPSHDPAVFTRIDLGYVVSTREKSNVVRNPDPTAAAVPQEFQKNDVSIDATVAYGLPGKPGYRYDRPFDYFLFEFTAATSNTFENIISRGLLAGTDYAGGDSYRGIWGLYGMFDYIAPQVFRVSNTGLGLGTTGQWWMSRAVALQTSFIGGAGYGAAGLTRGDGVGTPGPTGAGQRDYHYGFTPNGLIAWRLIFGDRVSVDSTIRDYYVSRVAASESTGSENIARGDVSLTLRVFNLHGLTVRYVYTRRDAHYEGSAPTNQRVGAISIVYSLLGQTHFGAVDWRPPEEGGPLK